MEKVLSDEEIAAIRRRVEMAYQGKLIGDVFAEKHAAIADVKALLEHAEALRNQLEQAVAGNETRA